LHIIKIYAVLSGLNIPGNSFTAGIGGNRMLRLVVLAILVYIGFRLLIGGLKKGKRGTKQKTPDSGPTGVADILVEDPVCHRLVPKGQAIHLQHQGSMIYFCSEDCCNTFVQKRKEG
jgi:YHS domain-containing protein